MAKYRVTVDYDSDNENPCSWGRFKVVSFNRNHVDYTAPDKLDTDDVRAKTNAGRAWLLDYYEHGQSMWSLSNDNATIDDWDSVSGAGILFLEEEDDTSTKEQLTEQAREFLKTYTQWCNGQIYYYQLEKISGECCPTCKRQLDNENIASCGGFYDDESMIESISSYLQKGDTVEVKGPASTFLTHEKEITVV